MDSSNAQGSTAVVEFLSADEPGLEVVDVVNGDLATAMEGDVASGLGAPPGERFIPPTYLYDRRGSEIYEEITRLPEYYPTRVETSILKREARAIREFAGPSEIVELGSGSSTKTRLLLDAWGARSRPVTYVPIDVSHTMLEASARTLREDYAELRVLGLAGRYHEALALLPADPARTVVFLGGTIGNFDDAEQDAFFRGLGARMAPGANLLIGFDRCAHPRKPAEVIRVAYDDAAGVTAQFNENLLRRLNRELDADFDPDRWTYRAFYDESLHRVEMYLESAERQSVAIGSLDRSFEFAEGERVLTELSRKYDPDELAAWFTKRGFEPVRRWGDEADYFCVQLLRWTGA